MEDSEDRRRFPRFPNPSKEDGRGVIQILVPELAGGSLGPEDFSPGGFRVVVFRQPQIDQVVACTLLLGEVELDGLRTRVVRIKENFGYPPTWEVGLSIEMENESRDHIASLLTAILAEN